MARVDAMNFGLLQAKGISSAADNGNVSSRGNTEQFEKIFNSKSTSQNDNLPEEKAPVSQKEFSVQGKDFSRKEDYVAQVPGQVQENVGQISDIQAVENEMKQIVKDVLGMDDVTLEETMAAMGVVITDLLNPGILQQFVLQVAGGEENVDFLTNEALLQNYNELFQALTDFVGENGDDVLLLMDVLDNPIPFQDVLETTPVEESAVSQLPAEGERETVSTQNAEAEREAIVQPVNQAVVKEQNGISSDMVEKVSVQKAEAVEEVAETPMEQNLSEDSDSGQFSGEAMEEDTTKLLYADRSDSSSAAELGSSVFTEQFHVVQGNTRQIMDVIPQEMQRMQQMVEIVKQVSEQIHSVVDADTTTMEMQLNPERLGKVLLTVSAKEGVMTANFKVQSEEAKQALESQMYQLRETLESKNLKVESVDVQISSFDFSQSNEAERQMREDYEKQGKKKFNFDAAEDEEDMEVSQETPEQTRRRVMLESGSSIDYTA